jgi:hypothetical protein
MAIENVTDVQVPEEQITVPAHVKRPQVKFSPYYFIKETDKVEVIIKLNGAEKKHWEYTPNSATYPGAGQGLLFVARLGVVETSKPE